MYGGIGACPRKDNKACGEDAGSPVTPSEPTTFLLLQQLLYGYDNDAMPSQCSGAATKPVTPQLTGFMCTSSRSRAPSCSLRKHARCVRSHSRRLAPWDKPPANKAPSPPADSQCPQIPGVALGVLLKLKPQQGRQCTSQCGLPDPRHSPAESGLLPRAGRLSKRPPLVSGVRQDVSFPVKDPPNSTNS